ncbi:MAG: GNAT family N-acetyltransferase [Clostridia bacterium]|nr:GNAT family N-acetyltransferase [Clostridia bacterium]
MNNTTILSLNILGEKEIKEVKALESICRAHDNIHLKLELDFKNEAAELLSKNPENINEFLCYADDSLIGYASILSFNPKEAEVTGMVHPDFRRQGIFTELFAEVEKECRRREFESVLLLADRRAASGKEFILKSGAKYKTSEYQMKNESLQQDAGNMEISLKPACRDDLPEVRRQDKMYFGSGELFEDEISENFVTYVIWREGAIIGKIKVDYTEDMPYIGGFGILPEHRGKGYGRQALSMALGIIKQRGYTKAQLEVECANERALNLYISCGFIETSVMDYYSLES